MPEITPEVLQLGRSLERAAKDAGVSPRFQRGFVWRPQDIIDLFDSISKQYPIGTLFPWGADPMPAHLDHLGLFKLPEYKGQTWLVLERQQRLTTLVGVLLLDDPQWYKVYAEDPVDWEIYFDAEQEVFSDAPPARTSASLDIAAPALLDTMELFSEANRILKSEAPETAEAWVNRAQKVARAIQGYRVPIVQFTTNNLSIAVESFSRLNKKGRGIDQDEMFSALTYEEGREGKLPPGRRNRSAPALHDPVGIRESGPNDLAPRCAHRGRADDRTNWSDLGEQVRRTPASVCRMRSTRPSAAWRRHVIS